jgi:hypothetical protein
MRSLVTVVALVLLSACTSRPVAAQPTPVAADSPSVATTSPIPSRSPSPSPIVFVTPSPAPVGKPIPSEVLAPARVEPAVGLCGTSIQTYADGNAGPLFCLNHAIIVAAWEYFAAIDPHVMALGPAATLGAVQSAISADLDGRSTNVIEFSGYQLATAYYGWKLAFDYWNFVTPGSSV